MTLREQCVELIDSFDETQLESVVTLLQSAKQIAKEAADDAFCARLYESSLLEKDDNDEDAVTLEEVADTLGIDIT